MWLSGGATILSISNNFEARMHHQHTIHMSAMSRYSYYLPFRRGLCEVNGTKIPNFELNFIGGSSLATDQEYI